MTTDLDKAVERLRAEIERYETPGVVSYGGVICRPGDLRSVLSALSSANARAKAAVGATKPTDGDLWWNPSNDEDGFTHWADAFEDANEDCEDYSVEIHRARKLPPVWGALILVNGEQRVRVFSTKAEADEALALSLGAGK